MALAVFTQAVTFLIHHDWAMPAGRVGTQQLMFMENIAVTGGLLAFVAFGPARFALGRR